jgi:hypothetical protein
MNDKEYLFLELDEGNCNVQELLVQCAQFKQIHIYLHNFEINKTTLDALVQLDAKLFLYCFNEQEYLYAVEHEVVPHLCWLNENIQGLSWIDELIKNHKNEVLHHEFFWMIKNDFINQLKDSEINDIVKKLQEYNIPICLNVSEFFNKSNTEFINLQSFIKKFHERFYNPLYLKEVNNINYAQGNYFLNNSLELKELLMGFFGDIIITDSKTDLLNIKNMNKSKDCLNCELQENCTTNKIGYFMSKYNTIKCWGPKLMSFN